MDTVATLFRAAAGARIAPRAAVAVTLLGFACGLGGCVSDGAGAGSGAFAMASGGATVKRRDHLATFDGFKSKNIRDTLCLHRGSPRIIAKSFSQNNFR